MCFDFVKPFCTQDSYVISSGEEILPASFPLSSDKTVLDNLASTIKLKLKRKEMRQGWEIIWADWENNMCAWVVNLVVKTTWGGKVGVTEGVWSSVSRGQYSLHQTFTVHYGCLKVFTFGSVELGRPVGPKGYTKELQLPGNRCVSVCEWLCVCQSTSEWWSKEGMWGLEGALQKKCMCVCVRMVVRYVVWLVNEKSKRGERSENNEKQTKKSCYSV